MAGVIRLVIVSGHTAEAEILDRAFRSLGFQVLTTAASPSNYLQILQYRPDAVLFEIPQNYIDALASVRLIRQNAKLRHIPVIGFGPPRGHVLPVEFSREGLKKYLERPLKMAVLLRELQEQFPGKNLTEAVRDTSAPAAAEQNQERLLDPRESVETKRNLMIQHIGKLMCFPFAASRVLQLSDQDDSGADDLAKIIAADQAMSSVILKVANSIHFASRHRVISSPKDAIVRLGFNEVRNIVLGLGVLQMLPAADKSSVFDRKQFWLHSLGRAVIAEKLAKHAGYPEPAKAFIGGLLADFGILLLDQFFPQVFARVVQCIAEKQRSVSDAVTELLGFHHTDLISALFAEWRLPADLVTALRIQPQVYAQDAPQNDSVRVLACAIAVSGELARLGRIGMGLDSRIALVPDGVMRALKQNLGVSGTFFDPVRQSLSLYMQFLNVEGDELQKVVQGDRAVVLVRLERRILDPWFLYMSGLWRVSLARDCAALRRMLAEQNWDLVVLEIGADDSAAIVDVFDALIGVKDRRGQLIGVLGLLCGGEEIHDIPPQIRWRWMRANGDLREFDQVAEALLV